MAVQAAPARVCAKPAKHTMTTLQGPLAVEDLLSKRYTWLASDFLHHGAAWMWFAHLPAERSAPAAAPGTSRRIYGSKSTPNAPCNGMGTRWSQHSVLREANCRDLELYSPHWYWQPDHPPSSHYAPTSSSSLHRIHDRPLIATIYLGTIDTASRPGLAQSSFSMLRAMRDATLISSSILLFALPCHASSTCTSSIASPIRITNRLARHRTNIATL
jgi:hypothetical protein